MINIKNRICNWITDNLSSLVKFTGLLVSIGVLVILCSCGDEAVLYDSAAESEGAMASDSLEENDDGDLLSEDVTHNPSNTEVVEVVSESGDAYDKEDRDKSVPEPVTSIIVHVCGAVKNPGVYELDASSRVIDAIEKAGGFGLDACSDALNLAAGISDGSKIYVPSNEEVLSEAVSLSEDNLEYVEAPLRDEGSSASDVAAGGRVNINTASKDELMTLSGIGATRAEAIIDYRNKNGAFKSIEDIMNVSGIKSGSFDKIKDNITVDR